VSTVKVQQYLEDFFTRKNREANRPAPQFSLKPLESDYVGLDVQGVRQAVIGSRDYWEYLQISIELRGSPSFQRIVCYLDGGYAAGLGTRVPDMNTYTDFAKGYQADLERFADQLLRGLQEYLASSR
jgi:hypothetical protein